LTNFWTNFTVIIRRKFAIILSLKILLPHFKYVATSFFKATIMCVIQQQGGHIEHLMSKLQYVTVTLDNN